MLHFALLSQLCLQVFWERQWQGYELEAVAVAAALLHAASIFSTRLILLEGYVVAACVSSLGLALWRSAASCQAGLASYHTVPPPLPAVKWSC